MPARDATEESANFGQPDETVLYVAGLLPEERARQLEQRAETDEELAAEILLLRCVVQNCIEEMND